MIRRLNLPVVHYGQASSVEYKRSIMGCSSNVLLTGRNGMRQTMNTYRALVTVPYHSGDISTWITVNADNFFLAKVILERLYGEGKVISPVMEV